jgi:hypothetical protein
MSINPKYNEILEREFRKAAKLEATDKVIVDFPEEEIIVVTVNGKKWTMEIGSDDDNFWFHDEAGQDVVSFDFPEDWTEIEENGPW